MRVTTWEGEVLAKAGDIFGAKVHSTGRTRYVQVYQVHRPDGQLPYVLAYELHPTTLERWEGKRGEHFPIFLTWQGRAWILPQSYVKEEMRPK